MCRNIFSIISIQLIKLANHNNQHMYKLGYLLGHGATRTGGGIFVSWNFGISLLPAIVELVVLAVGVILRTVVIAVSTTIAIGMRNHLGPVIVIVVVVVVVVAGRRGGSSRRCRSDGTQQVVERRGLEETGVPVGGQRGDLVDVQEAAAVASLVVAWMPRRLLLDVVAVGVAVGMCFCSFCLGMCVNSKHGRQALGQIVRLADVSPPIVGVGPLTLGRGVLGEDGREGMRPELVLVVLYMYLPVLVAIICSLVVIIISSRFWPDGQGRIDDARYAGGECQEGNEVGVHCIDEGRIINRL